MPFWKSKTNRIYTYAARHVRRRTHFSVRRLLISALVGFSAAARPKELAHDYLEREQSTDPTLVAGLVVAEWEKTRKPEQAPSAYLAVGIARAHEDCSPDAGREYIAARPGRFHAR
jgi:hypothetical protein